MGTLVRVAAGLILVIAELHAARAAPPAVSPPPSPLAGFPSALAKPVLAAPRRSEKAPALPPAEVETAEQLYAKLEYEDANKVAERIIARRGLTHDQLVRAYRVLAVTHAVLDHEDAAREAFILLLTYDAEYAADPNLGPKVSGPFFEARGFWRAQAVKPGIEVVAALRAQDPGTIRVTARDPTHIVKKVSVGYRWDSRGDFVVATLAASEGATVDVSAPPSARARLDYYAQGLDERDDVVLELGSPVLPRTALVEAPALPKPLAPEKSGGGSVFSSPVFWTLTSVLVVGAATTGGYFLLRPKDSAPTAATLTPTLQCGAGTKCN